MGKEATRAEVNDFLKRFKAKVDEQRALPLIPRRVNLSALAMLGIARSEVKTVVLGLTDAEYAEGPMQDQDGTPGEVWVFGIEYGSTDLYIKLKLDASSAVCLSFHPPGRVMRLPYR